MIIPSNLFLDHKERLVFEDFIQTNQTKIKAILVYLDIPPFDSNLDLNNYYQYIRYLIKKYKLKAIGFVNETQKSQFSQTLDQDIKKFKAGLEFFLSKGINTIIRPYNWYNFDLFDYKLQLYVPSESIVDIVKRTQNKEIFFAHLQYLENGINTQLIKPKQESIYHKRISLAHPDNTTQGDLFYKAFLNADPKFIDEVDDIYFGAEFIYDDRYKVVRYGNVMGVNATNEQIDYLFLIQEKLKINISLTLNQLNPPKDILYDPKVLDQFLLFIDSFYQRGLRVITISDTHLIKTKILHKRFPKMKFKNSVNHKISNLQDFINYAHLGYDYIQLDRSLNRDMNELKKIAKINKKLKKKLYLLSSEYCMYNCPYKEEHDNLNNKLIATSDYFAGDQKLSHISCDNWRMGKYAQLPRSGVDLILDNKKDLDGYLQYVDILKFSGRLYNLESNAKEKTLGFYFDDAPSLESKVKNRLKNRLQINNKKQAPSNLKEYDTKEGKQLLETLKTCKNQCFGCNLCEKVFKLKPFDSLIELNGNFG